MSAIFAYPTIRTLAAHLQTTRPDQVWESLVAVKPKGDKLPLFLVHPISGDIGYVHQLAPYLPDDQPIYGLQAVGLDGIADPLPTIEAIAAHYVQLIVDKQPTGPYALGGYSLGGIIAFEMARQLRHLGKAIRFVALIDCYPVNPSSDNPDQIPLGQLFRHYYHVWRSLPQRPGLYWQLLCQKAPMLVNYLVNRLGQSLQKRGQEKVIQPVESILSDQNRLLISSSQRAYSNYVFKPFDGKVVFLRAAGDYHFADTQRRVTFGWDRYAQQGVDVHLLAGNHYSLFKNEESISSIADILTACLTA